MTFPRFIGLGWLLAVAGALWTLSSARDAAGMGRYSDINRQWVVTQYVADRVDPYKLAHGLFKETYGPATGPDRIHLRDVKIFAIAAAKWDANTPGLKAEYGPPEATYPPSVIVLAAPFIGLLSATTVQPAMLGLNLLMLVAVVRVLAGQQADPRGALPWVIALTLLWPPVQTTVRMGQFSLVVLACALTAMRAEERRPWLAGLLYTFALLKPSLGLLFLVHPFVRGRIVPIAVPVVLHGLGTLAMAWWLGANPLTMMADWAGLCRYVLQGAYTAQEWLNALRIENTTLATVLVLAFFGAVTLWCFLHRRAPRPAQASSLGFANLMWTYHERQDFVAALPFFTREVTSGTPRRRLLGLVLFAVMAGGLLEVTYGGTDACSHAARWAARAATWTSAALAFWYLRRDAVPAEVSR